MSRKLSKRDAQIATQTVSDYLSLLGEMSEMRGQLLKAEYPYPVVEDCIDFARTELAEVLEAILRENPIYRRNNTKKFDKIRELGQLLWMIGSAILKTPGSKARSLDGNLNDMLSIMLGMVEGKLAMARMDFHEEDYDGATRELGAAFGLVAGIISQLDTTPELAVQMEFDHLKTKYLEANTAKEPAEVQHADCSGGHHPV